MAMVNMTVKATVKGIVMMVKAMMMVKGVKVMVMVKVMTRVKGECDDDDDDNTDTCSGTDSNSIVSPAVATHHEREHFQQEMQPEFVIGPALLGDQQGAQLLECTLSTSSASILVTTETMVSTYHLPEAVYGPRPVISAADHSILCTLKATTPAGMSMQIDTLHAHEKEVHNTHDAQAAQLVNKSQFQLAIAKHQRKKSKGIRMSQMAMLTLSLTTVYWRLAGRWHRILQW